MEIKINLEYESADSLFLTLLYEDYETLYWCYKEDLRKINEDPVRFGFKQQDILSYETDLEAYEVIADRYVVGSVNHHMKKIRDKIDYNDKLIRGMGRG